MQEPTEPLPVMDWGQGGVKSSFQVFPALKADHVTSICRPEVLEVE